MHYYLYQHRRLDTQNIFYIGIGQKNLSKIKGYRTEFERAYAKAKRTTFWKNIVAKTDYIVEIILQSEDCTLIQKEEIRLIKLYGRRCCDTNGILVNFQEGGERITGPKYRNIKIEQLLLSGEVVKVWDQLADIQKQAGYLITNIVKCCRKKQLTAYGYKWKYLNNNTYDKIRPSSARKKTTNRGVGITIIHKQTADIKFFRTINECAIYLGVHRTTAHKYLKNNSHKLYNINYNNW